jgi:hypothetical protein
MRHATRVTKRGLGALLPGLARWAGLPALRALLGCERAGEVPGQPPLRLERLELAETYTTGAAVCGGIASTSVAAPTSPTGRRCQASHGQLQPREQGVIGRLLDPWGRESWGAQSGWKRSALAG